MPPKTGLKGQSNGSFDLMFFHGSSLATEKWVIFSILIQISLSYSNFRFEKNESPVYHDTKMNKIKINK